MTHEAVKSKKPNFFKRLLSVRGMPSALTAFAGLIIIYIGFGLVNPVVFNEANVHNLLRATAKYLIIGIGQSFVLKTGNIDLSIGSVVGMSAMISATLMVSGIPALLAITISLIACLVFGYFNGFLIGKFKLPPFIATLGTMFVARGIAFMVNNNRNTDAISSGIGREAATRFGDFFFYGRTLGIFNTFWIGLAVFIAFFFVLQKTRTGRHIYAVGSNEDAARLSGVNVSWTITKAYLVSAFCAWLIGVTLVAQAGMGNMQAGNMYEMFGVAASVIGGVSPLGGSGILLGTFAGAAVWQVLANGLSMVGAQVGIQRIMVGTIVALAVLLDVVLRQRGSLFKKKKS